MDDQRLSFVGIGVQKAATSWLFNRLQEHPEIETANILDGVHNKELDFFNENYVYGYEWYHRRFDFEQEINGEYSVKYFWDENVPRRLHSYNPDLKLILSLRDPVERAFSQHKHLISRGRIPERLRPFHAALEQNPSYREQGLYATHLKRYLKFFSRDQIHVILVSDIRQDPGAVMTSLYEFLGCDSGFEPNILDSKDNESVRYRSQLLNRGPRKMANLMRHLGAGKLVTLLQDLGLPGLLRDWNEQPLDNDDVPSVRDHTREQLRNRFRDEITELEEILDRDLSHWLEP